MHPGHSGKSEVILFFPDPRLEGLMWHRMPFSVLAISSLLVDKGHRVRIFDERFERNLEKDLLGALPNAICVGISAFTGGQIKGAMRIARLVKERSPETPVVWGGWHPSIFPEQTAMDPQVDIAVYGQGERTLFELTEAFLNRSVIDHISGLCFKDGDRIIKTKPRMLEDINNFPPVPLHLVDIRNYIGPHDGLEDAMTLSYMSSQGCPYRCGFCADKRVYQRRWFGLKAERVIEDITRLARTYNLGAVYFEDNNFFIDKKRVEEICKGLIANGVRIKWEAMGHPRQLVRFEDGFWQLLKESGCGRLLIGSESGAQEVLDLIQKDASVEDTIAFVEKAARHGIIPILSTIVGFPESARKDFAKTIRMVVRLKQAHMETEWKMFLYTPYPGTDLYDMALKHGMKEPDSLLKWSEHTLRDVKTPWIDDNFRRDIRNIAFFYVQVAYPSARIMERINSKKLLFIIKPLFKLAQLLAKMRLELNFYAFPIEPGLYRLFQTMGMMR